MSDILHKFGITKPTDLTVFGITTDILKHFGVKGMRLGITRSRAKIDGESGPGSGGGAPDDLTPEQQKIWDPNNDLVHFGIVTENSRAESGYLKEYLAHLGVEPIDDILVHFGVKGMRWGVRTGVSSRSSGKSEHNSEDYNRRSEYKARAKKYGTSSLSNDELKFLNTRLNLEGSYAKLSAGDKSRAQKILGKIFGTGKGVIAFATSKEGQAVIKMVQAQAAKAKKAAATA